MKNSIETKKCTSLNNKQISFIQKQDNNLIKMLLVKI